MFNASLVQIAMHGRQASSPAAVSHRTERLRRVGYADGERQPRTPRHWANR